MTADWIAYIAIISGMCLLGFSIRPACHICQNDETIGWKLLVALIVFFFIGYGLFLLRLATAPVNSTLLLLSCILFGGAVFVAGIIPQALKTILKIESVVEVERHNSLTDSMTGLANRKHLFQHLSALSGGRKPFSLLFVDLNNFKQINDGLGHYYGDQFLIAVSKRIENMMPDNGRLFRIGGDEFAIVYREHGHDKLIALIDELHTTLSKPIQVNTHAMTTSASIGVACFPEHSQEMFELVKKADIAMYDCKNRQGNFTFYDDSIGARAEEKLALSQRLSEAVQHNQFKLHYQPIIDTVSQEPKYVEALLRWPQANGDVMLPESFIPLATQSTLINAITYWVIEQAANDLPQLRAHGFDHCIHINLTSRDLQNDNLVQQLKQLKYQHKLASHDLMFELTENDIVEDLAQAKRIMHKISAMGFEFCIDNFGTGFSSLVLLRELPISQIKIDRTFVDDFLVNDTSRAIICHIISLANDLHCSVVAEGVEQRENALELARLGAELHQGWWYAAALPIDQLPTVFEQPDDDPELLVC